MNDDPMINIYGFCTRSREEELTKFKNVDFTNELVCLEDSRDMDFNKVEKRLGYMYMHGYNVIASVEKCVLDFFGQCLEAEKNFFIRKTKICTLSNGPGIDVVGYLSALHKSKKIIAEVPLIRGINLYESWQDMFLWVTSNAYWEYQHEGFRIPIPLENIQFFQNDIYSTISPEVENCITGSDVFFMVNVFQSSKATFEVLRATMQKIFALLQPGSVVFYIGSKSNVTRIINLVFEENPINIMYGPLKIKLEKIELNDTFIEKIGIKPKQSDTSYFAVLQKKYDCSDIKDLNVSQEIGKTTKKRRKRRMKGEKNTLQLISNEQLCNISMSDTIEDDDGDEDTSVTSSSKESNVSNESKNLHIPVQSGGSNIINTFDTEKLQNAYVGAKVDSQSIQNSNNDTSISNGKQCNSSGETNTSCKNNVKITEMSKIGKYIPPCFRQGVTGINSTGAGNETHVKLVTDSALPKRKINSKGNTFVITKPSKTPQKSSVSKSWEHLVDLYKQNKEVCNDNLQGASNKINKVLQDIEVQTSTNGICKNSKKVKTKSKVELEYQRKMIDGASQTNFEGMCSHSGEYSNVENNFTFYSMYQRCQTLISSLEKLIENINRDINTSNSENRDMCSCGNMDSKNRKPYYVCSNYHTQSCCKDMQGCCKNTQLCCKDMQSYSTNAHTCFNDMHCRNTHLCSCMNTQSHCKNIQSSYRSVQSQCKDTQSCENIQSYCKDMLPCTDTHSCSNGWKPNIHTCCNNKPSYSMNTPSHCRNIKACCKNICNLEVWENNVSTSCHESAYDKICRNCVHKHNGEIDNFQKVTSPYLVPVNDHNFSQVL